MTSNPYQTPDNEPTVERRYRPISEKVLIAAKGALAGMAYAEPRLIVLLLFFVAVVVPLARADRRSGEPSNAEPEVSPQMQIFSFLVTFFVLVVVVNALIRLLRYLGMI